MGEGGNLPPCTCKLFDSMWNRVETSELSVLGTMLTLQDKISYFLYGES